jgi:hypothetical protein
MLTTLNHNLNKEQNVDMLSAVHDYIKNTHRFNWLQTESVVFVLDQHT